MLVGEYTENTLFAGAGPIRGVGSCSEFKQPGKSTTNVHGRDCYQISMIQLTNQPIDFTAVTESVRSHNAGAVVLFMGTVREFTGEAQTSSLEYDAYPQMAVQAMEQLESEARSKWELVEISLVHRSGQLQLGEIAVAVAVSAGHRAEAFEAGRWLIDTLKERVPIWKKELFADGTTEWIHPDETDSTGVSVKENS